jgi:beta-glucosidase
MTEFTTTRRGALIAASALLAWARHPARALLAGGDASDAHRPAIDALIARMTIAEKAGQLTLMPAAWGGSAAGALNPPGAGGTFDAQLAEVRGGRLTGVFNGAGAEMARRMQTVAVRETRLGVPLLFAADVIHGHRTIFPVPLAEAASFDPALAGRTARAAATEAAAAGIDWTFAPMVDIARDQRWGRGVEGAGEDVLLGRLFAAARVRGFQGRSLGDDDALMACAKHFVAYGAAEGGLDYNTVDVSERTLRDVYFPPFEAAINAGVGSVMASFNEVSGVPSTGNRWLLTHVLRDEWRFAGVTVSDYTGDEEMIAHGFAADARAATRIAIMAGVDMSMASGLYRDHLPALVAAGAVPIARVDQAVRRVLAAKARLGLFDDPFRRIDPVRERARSRTPAALALAREAARRSVVMVKNERDLLPLRTAGQRIALIGPFAAGAHDLIGPWNVYGDDAQAVDLATGLRAQMADPAALTVIMGSDVLAPIAGGIASAVAAAYAADVVLLAVGESQLMSGEAESRTAVTLPAPQQALAEAVAATGKPIVILLKNGRALALEGAVLAAPAILITWFLGSETGNALADLLFGRASPSARLPISFPQESGQEPFYYAHKTTGRPNPPGPPQPYKAQYQTVSNEARFPFGHGLTYGRFAYERLSDGGARLPWNGRLELAATIVNHGRYPAIEVAQLYVRDRAASITQPIRRLIGFVHVPLAPGQSAPVRFTITRADLMFTGTDLRPTVEPGLFDFWIGPSSVDGVSGQFALLAV